MLNRVAALVNGQVVTLQEVEQRAGASLRAAEEYPAGQTRDRARAEALQRAFDSIVADKLFEEKAKELEIEVTDQQVEAAIEGVKKQNGFSDAQFEQALRAEGLDPAAYRARIRRELQTFQLLQYKVGSKVKASDEDLRNYYQSHPQEFEGAEEVHVRHIFLPLPEGAERRRGGQGPRRGRAESCSALKVGEDFAKVAQRGLEGPVGAGGRRPRLAAPRHAPAGLRGRRLRARDRPDLGPGPRSGRGSTSSRWRSGGAAGRRRSRRRRRRSAPA